MEIIETYKVHFSSLFVAIACVLINASIIRFRFLSDFDVTVAITFIETGLSQPQVA